ncbi:PadR family transcriptional regulator [Streptomyces sp. HPF1205]|uniref:PadR family transcriptional regulator n=1 Tax=Streptomyces sp. HPF1205 TaxID=2873262 RepID=UPI001CEDCD28|nr:PadR family transcriptional regulator [Streptomyces sp. HPF1205]
MSSPSSEQRAQWLRGVLDLCILAALASHESYGYELSRMFEAEGLGVIPGGTLYPALTRLRGSGLVTSTWREPVSSGPARKYYALTDKGRDVLREGGLAWLEFTDRVAGILRKEDLP